MMEDRKVEAAHDRLYKIGKNKLLAITEDN